jgi:hypothetical protein
MTLGFGFIFIFLKEKNKGYRRNPLREPNVIKLRKKIKKQHADSADSADFSLIFLRKSAKSA